jgi:hypothetical protein
MFHNLIVSIMNIILAIAIYFVISTLGAIVTQFTGHSGRNIREALLVWWFWPLVLVYSFTSLVFEGSEGFANSLKDFRKELMNSD